MTYTETTVLPLPRFDAVPFTAPGSGTFTGRNYHVFLDNLDPAVQGILENQLNHTKNMFEDAQNAMNEVLKNGGTMAEARKAYFERASISRDQMETLTKPQIVIENNTGTLVTQSQIIDEESQESQPTVENFAVNGTASNLGNGSTIVSVYAYLPSFQTLIIVVLWKIYGDWNMIDPIDSKLEL